MLKLKKQIESLILNKTIDLQKLENFLKDERVKEATKKGEKLNA